MAVGRRRNALMPIMLACDRVESDGQGDGIPLLGPVARTVIRISPPLLIKS